MDRQVAVTFNVTMAWVSGFVVGGVVGVVGSLSAQKPVPAPECLDKALMVPTFAGGEGLIVSCTHREHVLQRGREDGALWLCICDAKGSEARRARP